MATRRLEVEITGDATSLNRALGKTQDQSNSLAKSMGKAGLAGVAVGLGAAVKLGFDEFNEAQRVTAQTNAVLKSTGGTANVTTGEVQKLSEALMRKSGVDDEAIQSGQNMLLTFTKLRNETGKGNKEFDNAINKTLGLGITLDKQNDVFNQATKATLDLSVAMGKDMQSSAILVGKALNDPVKGVSALTKAGVQLDSQQKGLIKTLVEGAKGADAIAQVYDGPLSAAQSEQLIKLGKLGMGWEDIAKEMGLKFTPAQKDALKFLTEGGHAMEAQKIILKELETQFGGSAAAAGKTFSGQINIAKQSLLNLAGEGVAKAGPALGTFATKINEDVVPIVKRLYGWFNDNVIPVLKNLATVAGDTWAKIAKVLKEHEPEIKRILGAVETAAELIGKTLLWLVNNVWIPVVGPVFRTVIPVALGLTIDAFDLLFRGIGKVRDLFIWLRENGGAAVQKVWNIADEPLRKLRDAFSGVASVIGKVVDGIKWLIDKIPSIPKLPSFLGGDPFDPTRLLPPSVGATAGVTGNDATINPSLWDELGLARRFGLTLTSGYRPGAITASGHPSDHSIFPSKAIDVAGSAASMAGFFRALIGNRGVKQAFYDPLGSIFGGTLSGYREGGHSDHVHVATYDRGGYLQPGWNLAYNGLGRPEPVGAAMGPQTIVVQLGDTTLARLVRNAKGRYEQQNGRGSF